MKKSIMSGVVLVAAASYALAADVNFDVNVKNKQGNSETSISVGNQPKPAPPTVVVKEKTVIIKEQSVKSDENKHDNGKKKGHYKEKHKKHKKHDNDENHEKHHRD